MASYAAPTDMTARYDIRRVGQLVRDDGSEANATALSTDPVLAVMLADATSFIQAALVAGGRYTDTDLTTFAADSAHNNILIRLTCDLTWIYLNARRGYSKDELKQVCPLYDDTMTFIEGLREGTRVFEVAGRDSPDKPENVVIDDPAVGLVNLVSSANRLFGDIANGMLPPS